MTREPSVESRASRCSTGLMWQGLEGVSLNVVSEAGSLALKLLPVRGKSSLPGGKLLQDLRWWSEAVKRACCCGRRLGHQMAHQRGLRFCLAEALNRNPKCAEKQAHTTQPCKRSHVPAHHCMSGVVADRCFASSSRRARGRVATTVAGLSDQIMSSEWHGSVLEMWSAYRSASESTCCFQKIAHKQPIAPGRAVQSPQLSRDPGCLVLAYQEVRIAHGNLWSFTLKLQIAASAQIAAQSRSQ